MISKVEREHIQKLKQWSAESREALREIQNHPIVSVLLKKVQPIGAETVFDNVDWLIALMERELHTQDVKNLLAAVEAHEGGRK